MSITDKYAIKILGHVICYDRTIFRGYIPNRSYAEAMTTYLKVNGIHIFGQPSFSRLLTERVRQNAEQIKCLLYYSTSDDILVYSPHKHRPTRPCLTHLFEPINKGGVFMAVTDVGNH